MNDDEVTSLETSQDSTPIISFIIPAYNEEGLLPVVLSAVRNNVHKIPYEMLVIDNGSTDKTVSVARNHGARILEDPNKTIAGLRNLGVKHSTGSILIFLDADVIITEAWGQNISQTILEITENRRVITGSRYGVRNNPSWIERCWFKPMTQEHANYINGGHLIVERHIFDEVRGFNDSLVTGEDWDFCMRAKKKGIRIVNNSDLYVVHEGYPKTLRQFIRREKWHGTQDFRSFNSFRSSKPAILATLYWCIGLFCLALSIYSKSMIYIFVGVALMSGICLVSTFKKRTQYELDLLSYFALFHVYFFARGLTLFEKLSNKCWSLLDRRKRRKKSFNEYV